MKKLKLRALDLGAKEVLTRTQLKNVLGGGGLVSTTSVDCYCYNSSDPDNGKDVTCGCPTSIESCCGDGYDRMNCGAC